MIVDENHLFLTSIWFYLHIAMRKYLVIIIVSVLIFFSISFSKENLRDIYSRPAVEWPAPFIDAGIKWNELSVLPPGPVDMQNDSVKNVVELGKVLFFDTRLSGSGKISCATCHKPELNWTDGVEKSLGHEGAVNKRNSPTIQNSWFYTRFFWDGRSKDLQDQAFAPINSSTEMHSDMPDVMRKLRNINGYKELFKSAFGSEEISPDKMTDAIATFEKTITTNKSRFDKFLEGDKNALTKKELRGLHLFRTKARCMNCHNGPFFSDNQFHNNGFFFPNHYSIDKGHYLVTHIEADTGKFKTPSLRDVGRTGPWMHDGSATSLAEVLAVYNKGGVAQYNPLVKQLNLSKQEISELLSFLKAISAPPVEFIKPVIPQ